MRYTDNGFSVAFFWPTDTGYATQPHWCRRQRKPKSHSEAKGPDTIQYQSELCAGNSQPVNREPSLIGENRQICDPYSDNVQKKKSRCLRMLTQIYISSCVESIKPEYVPSDSGLSDKEIGHR